MFTGITYRDFGLHAYKVWQTVMLIRNESKAVIDTMQPIIMTGWDIQNTRAILSISYVVSAVL
jgi:hypothetical protein